MDTYFTSTGDERRTMAHFSRWIMHWQKTPLMQASGTALLVCVFGFGALSLFWVVGEYEEGLDGLFDYPSATWGDGLLLPLAAGGLVYMRTFLPSPQSHIVRFAAGAVGFVGGTAVIVQWLSDPRPGLNWTMPQPHLLNTPGWWHAAFLVGASTFFAYLFGDFIHRLRIAISGDQLKAGQRILGSGALALTVGAFLGFSALAAHDSFAHRQSQAGFASLVAVALSACILIAAIGWASRGNIRLATAPLLAAIPIGVAFASVALYLPLEFVTIVFVLAAGAIGLSVGMTGEIGEEEKGHGAYRILPPNTLGSSTIELISVPALFILLPIAARASSTDSRNGLWPLLLALLAVLVFLFMLRRLRRGKSTWREDRPWLFTAIGFVVAISGGLALYQTDTMSSASAVASLAFTLLATLLAGPAIKLCNLDLNGIIAIEVSPYFRAHGTPSTEQRAVRTRLYIRLAASGVAALLSVLGLTLLTGYSLAWSDDEQNITLPAEIIALAAVGSTCGVVLMGISLLFWAEGPFNTSLGKIGIVGIVVIASGSLMGLSIVGYERFSLPAAIQSLIIALFSAECIVSNGLRLKLARPRFGAKMIVFSSGLGIGAFAYWSLTSGIGTTAAPIVFWQSAVISLVSYCIVGLLIMGATMCVFGQGGVGDNAPKDRFGAATQNALMLLPMWVLMAWMPRVIFVHIPQQNTELHRLVMVALVFVGFLALYIAALLWLIKANDTHVGRKHYADADIPWHHTDYASHYDRIVSLKDRLKTYSWNYTKGTVEERKVLALTSHTAAQNTFALSLVIGTFIGIFWLLLTDLDT